jgi:signal transduction histidine kinase/DNA-binding response OmpR family regulator
VTRAPNALDVDASTSNAQLLVVGGGDTGALVRAIDWSTTPLGPSRAWPESLRTALRLCVSSRFPIALYWGDEFVMLYNDALLPMVGANKHPQAMGRPAFEVLPEIRGIIEPLLQHVRTTGEATWSEDLMLPLVRGAAPEESYFTFTYSPIHDESNAVAGVFCAVIETTEKVIEERRLRLLNALAEGAQAKTREGACAAAASQIARFSSDVPFALVYLVDDRTQVARLAGASNIEAGSAGAPTTIDVGDESVWPLGDLAAGASPRLVELDRGPAGARAAVVLAIERSGGGRPLGFFVAGLSPMLRKSASYDRFHTLLASSLSQTLSNAAAHEEERKRAESLAELDRAKTTFFSNVSHEFRTPLTLMLAPIQDLLAAREGAPVDRPTVELLERNAMRLLKLVNTLLAFSRIEAGRSDAAYEPTDLAASTSDLSSTFRAAIERAGISFVVDCPPLSEPVYVDRSMWEKIVLNLLSNAFKFTFEGSITVRLRLRDDAVVLDVTDTGTGIAAAELPRVFERFHRIEGARSRTHEGSGIGLALVHELVRLHGGHVEVASRVGVGTTFELQIPRGAAHLPADRVHAARPDSSGAVDAKAFVDEAARWSAPNDERSPEVSASATPRERVLFADDNADMRDYVTRLLGDRWTVHTVSDGVSALESIRRAPPDLVLSDVMMPGMDGFALVRAMRGEAALRGIPVMLLSARAGDEEAAKGLAVGANDYIAKPFSARDLLLRVSSNLATARATRALAAVEERERANLYRHFMQAPFPVAVLKGPAHVIELANPSILKAWGRTAAVVGLPLAEAVSTLRDQPFLGYLDEVYRTGVAYEGREHAAHLPTGRDGALEEVFFNFVYAPLRDPNDAVEGILVSAFDVSAQVRVRRESARAFAMLEEANAARAEALSEATRANRAKDEFLTTMSHELRTPLNAIVGWASLLRAGSVAAPQVSKALETIDRNARMQARLIEDMLDLARIEQGKLVLSVGPTEMVRVVEAALDTVRPAAELKGVRLQSVLDSHATIVGDAVRLQQVAWNLLSNAIKFTPKGHRVYVRLRREQSHVELLVEDDGQGIDAAFLPHVFDRFKQADARITRKTGGLGLGLAIVKSIVELHGGTVTAHSDGAERGSSFVVRLPTAPLRAEAPPSADPTETNVAGPSSFECPPQLAGLRVLVVDDEQETRELLRYLLEQCEAVVALAPDAEAGLGLLRDREFDVLVSDVGMPGVDGYAFIRSVRALPPAANAGIPAVALTAYARSEDRTAALRAGFDMHLTKPIEPSELVVVIATLVTGVQRRRGA